MDHESSYELLGALDRTASDRDHARRPTARLFQVARFELPECGLAALFEDLGDPTFGALDLGVKVDEGTAESARDLDSHRRLAGSHEADENDVAV
jgi:hypothetical protein